MSSFLGYDYELTSSCIPTNTSSEVDALVEEMRKVADTCVWDAHASAQYSITSMYRSYVEAPTTAGEPPFAFALPDNELKGEHKPDPKRTVFEVEMGGGGEPNTRINELAQRIVELKRAGKDAEAIELLMGAGGRIIEGFIQP